MKRLKHALVFVVAAMAGCVPASEEHPPAGAAGFDIEPSAETKSGFVTKDGWTVHVERFVVQVNVSATAMSLGYGNSEPYLFDALKPARVFARALPVGPAQVHLTFYGRYIGESGYYSEQVERINVDAETEARFNRPPDVAPQSDYGRYTPGPSMLIVVRAEGERTITLDLAMHMSSGSRGFDDDGGGTTAVDVPEDDIAAIRVFAHAENLFPLFHDVAAADRDGDGRVTGVELADADLIERIQRRMNEDVFLER